MQNRIEKEVVLKKFFLDFGVFNEEEIEAIVQNTQVKLFKKGTILLRENEICDQCYFIISGCVRQYQLVNGEERNTAFFVEKQAAILYESYINKKPSRHYLACIEDSVLITGTREQELELHKKYPKLTHLVNTIMPRDFIKIQDHLSSLINNSPEERYIDLMKNRPELLNRVPLYQLASYIGVTPESFSRIRKRIMSRNN